MSKAERKKQEKIDNLAPERSYQEMTYYSDSDDSNATKSPMKKRGRKKTEPKKYFHETEEKIAAWKNELKCDMNKNGKKLTEDEKKKLINRISAQRSRSNKKLELENLYMLNRELRQKSGLFANIL